MVKKEKYSFLDYVHKKFEIIIERTFENGNLKRVSLR